MLADGHADGAENPVSGRLEAEDLRAVGVEELNPSLSAWLVSSPVSDMIRVTVASSGLEAGMICSIPPGSRSSSRYQVLISAGPNSAACGRVA